MNNLSRRIFLSAMTIAVIGGRASAESVARPVQRVALKGYDPVSYHTEGKAEQGSKAFSFDYDDTTYWFKSAAHRDTFVSDPERYAPQFYGYCAVQLSRGRKVEADPEVWTITNGKLYVFSGKKGLPMFQEQTAEIIHKANDNVGLLRGSR